LPEAALQFGYAHSYSDLCLSMGSSLRVTPAADLPKIVGKRGRLVIVNLQSTPLDDLAALRINAKTDDVMTAVMAKLGMEIPPFRLSRYLRVSSSLGDGKESKDQKSDDIRLLVEGVAVDGVPFSLFKNVEISFPTAKLSKTLKTEPFALRVPLTTLSKCKEATANLQLSFFGHYGEPTCVVPHALSLDKTDSKTYRMVFNPAERKWAEPVLLKSEELKTKAVLKNVRDKPYKTDVAELTATLVAMGFKEDDSREALRAQDDDIGEAVRRLVGVRRKA